MHRCPLVRTPLRVLFTIALLVLASRAEAEHGWWRGTCWAPSRCSHPCCDNYCPKPIPCPPGRPCTTCDDYCRKPIPCVCVPLPRVCESYCPKPLPRLTCPDCFPNWICGPGSWRSPASNTPSAALPQAPSSARK